MFRGAAEVAPIHDLAARIGDRHREDLEALPLPAGDVEDGLHRIDAPDLMRCEAHGAPVLPLLGHHRQERVIGRLVRREAGQLVGLLREGVGVVRIVGEGQGPGAVEQRPPAALLRRHGPSQAFPFGHVEDASGDPQGTSVGGKVELAAHRQGAVRPVRPDHANRLLSLRHVPDQAGAARHPAAILRMHQPDQQVVARPGRLGIEPEDAEQAGRPDMLIGGEAPSPRAADAAALEKMQEMPRREL